MQNLQAYASIYCQNLTLSKYKIISNFDNQIFLTTYLYNWCVRGTETRDGENMNWKCLLLK